MKYKKGDKIYYPKYSVEYQEGVIVSSKEKKKLFGKTVNYLVEYEHVSYPEKVITDKFGGRYYEKSEKVLKKKRITLVNEDRLFS